MKDMSQRSQPDAKSCRTRRRVLAYLIPESAIGMMKIVGHIPFNANHFPAAAAPWRFVLGEDLAI